ncbi:reticulophagy regulator 3-like [Penaeus japonicus]|uniref:reticulophagy regulator 3-like n=1 Tax=Penaeus japonicus TaxID=27405 RepID=UPI001C70B2B3|nr:reticulophagy regulator 3-like [Penaeus japonicus]XP_042877222.1 reticulophagy regulator 3-like [Penaeus japonicus]
MASWRNALLRLWPFRSENNDSSASQWGRKTETRKIARALGPWEAYMVTVQSILIWESPGTSALAVVGVNILFWLVVWSELRVYFVASVAALAVFLHQQWVHTIWPEIRVPKPEPDDTEDWTPVHPSVLSVPEISQYVEGAWRCICDNYTWLLHLRRVQPALFCAIVSTVLSVGAVVGHLVPGAVLVYILLMLVMTGPGILLHVLPDSFYERLAKMRAALRGEDSEMEISNVSLDSDLTEFMPELQSAEAQAALDVPLMSQDPPEVEQMVEEAYLQEEATSERTTRKRTKNTGEGERSEGVPAAQGLTLPLNTEDGISSTFFTSGLPEDFPSYDHDSVEDLDGPDLELPDLPKVVREPVPERQGAGGDRYQMEFVSSHFGDSSEEEDAFLEGLTFEERIQARPEPRAQMPTPSQTNTSPPMDPIGQLMTSVIAQNAGNVLSALGQNLMTSVIGQAAAQAQPPPQVSQQPRRTAAEPAARMTRSQDRQQQSVTDLEEDFELISDEEFQ